MKNYKMIRADSITSLVDAVNDSIINHNLPIPENTYIPTGGPVQDLQSRMWVQAIVLLQF